MSIPNSLREKYLQEREHLYALVDKLDDAILALAAGNVASYSLGNRSVSYTDIEKLKSTRNEAEDRINELEALLSGRSIRNVSVSTFLDPSILLPRR